MVLFNCPLGFSVYKTGYSQHKPVIYITGRYDDPRLIPDLLFLLHKEPAKGNPHCDYRCNFCYANLISSSCKDIGYN